MMRLAIITTHPVQYYAPVFAALAEANSATRVFYTWGEAAGKKYDPGFGRHVEWDIPLLQGYDYTLLKNTSTKPGTHHFRGIINPQCIAAINDFNPDVVLVYGWSWQSHLQIMRHFARKRAVWFRGDSTLLDPSPSWRAAVKKVLLRWVYSHVAHAFYVGTENKKYYLQYGLKEAQLSFAPHAIDNRRFATDYIKEARTLREQANIPLTAKVILYAGKLEPKKDPFTLLRAFEVVQDDNCYLLFVGNGALETELKTAAAHSSKQESIRFLPFQNQSAMPALYQAANVFCLPSKGPGETWGLAVNEAMAAGRPAVVSDKVGCAEDLVLNSVAGRVFRAGDASDLAERLSASLGSAPAVGEWSEAAKAAVENWSYDKQVAVYLRHLHRNP